MNSKILKDLIEKYNITKPDLFLLIVNKVLTGGIKENEVGYNLHTALNMDLTPAVELATELTFLPDKDKSAIIKELQETLPKQVDLNEEIRGILLRQNLSLDENVNNRLNKLISSYLQDVRDDLDVQGALTRPVKIAGIGLTEQEAGALFNEIKAKKAEWQKAGIDFKTAFSSGPVQEEEIDVKAKVAAPKSKIPLAEESPDVTIDQILAQRALASGKSSQMPPKPIASTRPTPQTTPFVEDIKEEEEFLESTEELPAPAQPQQPEPAPAEPQRIVPPPVRQPELKQPMIRQTQQPSSRPQMSDVKFEPKLYGPLDELSAMRLPDFRRLSKDPWLAIQKISGKLAILEGESVVRKNDGINALKNSPLYNVYADIMSRALTEGKSFEQVVKERGDITLDEFKAIMELNKSFKY